MKATPAKSTRVARIEATEQDPRWRTVLARDAAADGSFVFAVRSTGVFCRPSCAARHARPENVGFYADPQAARQAGFRPCKRCAPEAEGPAQRRVQLVTKLCRAIEAAAQPLSLRELGAIAGLSPFHVQRVFQSVTGITPRAFAVAQRAERTRRKLAGGAKVTNALYAAGYGSSGRFYAESQATLGMLPKHFRAGGKGERIQFAGTTCSLGKILVASTAHGVCAILFGDDWLALEADLRRRFAKAEIVAADGNFRRTLAAVVAFVEVRRPDLHLPLDVRGTAFQQRVWQALREIPAGRTCSYRELGERLGIANGARAVAAACAQNPLAVVVPCHRVVRADGALAGFRWGLERKRALLAREAESAP